MHGAIFTSDVSYELEVMSAIFNAPVLSDSIEV